MKLTLIKKYFPMQVIVCLVVFLILSVALFMGVRQKSQSFYFQDETEHVALGWMISQFDKKIYQDLSSNHQPLPILVGAVLAKTIPYVTLFDLIERLRIVMFVVLTMAGVSIVIRFKVAGVVAYLLTYSMGFYFFAWHVLAESLVIPAILYLFLFIFERLFQSNSKESRFEVIDGILISLSFFLIIFSMIPLWPFCLLAGLFLLFNLTKKQRIIAASCFATLTVLLFAFISPADWYRETVFNNTHYYIAYEKALTQTEIIRLIFYPLLPFLNYGNRLGRMFLLPLLLVIGITLFLLVRYKKRISKKQIASVLFLYLLLISQNSRVFDFPVAFYRGFHLFPFTAAFFAVFASVYQSLFLKLKQKKQLLLFSMLAIVLFAYNLPWLLENTDKLNEYYIQYGTQDSYGRLISTLKQPTDTFFSGPDGHGYINMMSGLPIAGRQLFHLDWAYRSPQLREEFSELFRKNPPTFILLYEDVSGYHRDLQPILREEYTEFLHNGKSTHLYIRNIRTSQITAQQQEYLKEKDFSFASL